MTKNSGSALRGALRVISKMEATVQNVQRDAWLVMMLTRALNVRRVTGVLGARIIAQQRVTNVHKTGLV